MSTHTVQPHLGQQILVVMDSKPEFHYALRGAVAQLPERERLSMTLLCCCPARYWEHGGTDDETTAAASRQIWEAQEKDFSRAQRCLQHAAALLEETGVLPERITQRVIADKDRLLTAVMAELSRIRYTGVIVSRYHPDIISRLQRRGVTDLFRNVPDVHVWVLDVSGVVERT